MNGSEWEWGVGVGVEVGVGVGVEVGSGANYSQGWYLPAKKKARRHLRWHQLCVGEADGQAYLIRWCTALVLVLVRFGQ